MWPNCPQLLSKGIPSTMDPLPYCTVANTEHNRASLEACGTTNITFYVGPGFPEGSECALRASPKDLDSWATYDCLVNETAFTLNATGGGFGTCYTTVKKGGSYKYGVSKLLLFVAVMGLVGAAVGEAVSNTSTPTVQPNAPWANCSELSKGVLMFNDTTLLNKTNLYKAPLTLLNGIEDTSSDSFCVIPNTPDNLDLLESCGPIPSLYVGAGFPEGSNCLLKQNTSADLSYISSCISVGPVHGFENGSRALKTCFYGETKCVTADSRSLCGGRGQASSATRQHGGVSKLLLSVAILGLLGAAVDASILHKLLLLTLILGMVTAAAGTSIPAPLPRDTTPWSNCTSLNYPTSLTDTTTDHFCVVPNTASNHETLQSCAAANITEYVGAGYPPGSGCLLRWNTAAETFAVSACITRGELSGWGNGSVPVQTCFGKGGAKCVSDRKTTGIHCEARTGGGASVRGVGKMLWLAVGVGVVGVVVGGF
ncbi:hypothetical protein BU26DRAFT_568025 [Trematosphaeria pertusa]|uniref:Uncharacterized protein n=1 Tax=Trematosphaeria pertusa TaxID=390896 RepID=A0A6A6I5D7_9PLEO|nr:uncharacterized protein BU26DRAFT_568025 [Trematosphaeria pertusa]KAF2245439.1 hypothetical protein BU26DRAFT_568025 [Trematosphaeria pertusa]